MNFTQFYSIFLTFLMNYSKYEVTQNWKKMRKIEKN